MEEEIKRYIDALDGISVKDWNKLKMGMDRMFEEKRKELDKTIKSNSIDVEKIILSQFE
ncbi:MAG: hypothetical protein RR766_00095 [Longicatena sp.]|uniref:hypothetical protein n=1 Tax=Anaerorhabdus sp. TaxID=1872524 RepID=UPI002FC5DFE3